MSLSDDIRKFTFENYIRPAREKGQKTIKLRSGDIHSLLKYSNRLPAVCSAIGTNKFQEEYGVRLLEREGPSNGANMYFTFEI